MKLPNKIKVDIFNESKKKNLPKTSGKKIIELILKDKKIKKGFISIIYCTDEYLLNINREYLNHNYTTDVITFVLEEKPLLSEIYISIDTASTQSTEYNVSLRNEILRLIAHGALHIVGYDDRTDESREKMRLLEDFYLSKLKGK